ncbi:Transcriptional regulator, LysR family [Labilithrix luteola]|uniref:Transcriptional regulator, LysR family n=1 Tax=Labilithrix luteola TaxID=1391654 RepID=A0A0K1PWG7_9BACT|nr:LysR family transcriptional regulator [Labilithrix luteola]AKU97862.1 Transcriptional regulator, LysR family [Labilithrix luteola]
MRGREYADLRAFMAIATHGSFARAAKHLRVSPSALSQTLRGLEERLGVRLLNRTTRSVAPSEAGARLLARLGPAMTELESAVAEVTHTRERPAGTLRITMPHQAMTLLGPLLGRFYTAYPEVVLDIMVDDKLADIVKDGFDAGIRIGERLEKDMIALKLGGDFEMIAVGTPEYFAQHGIPKHPRDLHRHRCINWRWPTDGSLYRWEFARGKQTLEIAVEGPLVVTDVELALHGALDGVGIAYLFHPSVLRYVEDGRLMRVLEPWSPGFPGLHLFYPSRRHIPRPLRAFVDFLRKERVIR